MDGRTENGQKMTTIAHPEQSSGELKMCSFWHLESSLPKTQETKAELSHYSKILFIPFNFLFGSKPHKNLSGPTAT